VAVGRTYLFPPLSSGGASLVRPWLRFHTPLIGGVEDWRAGLGRCREEWGWTTPALVGEDGGLIAGHARILPAR
jgi:hypothetical protein